jgi:hypothetical protein
MTRVRELLERAKQTLPGRLALKAMEDNVPSQAVLIAWNMLQTIFPIALALASIPGHHSWARSCARSGCSRSRCSRLSASWWRPAERAPEQSGFTLLDDGESL